MYLTQRGR